MKLEVSEKQSLAKIIAGVRGGSSPCARFRAARLMVFVFEFKQKAPFTVFDFRFFPEGHHVLFLGQGQRPCGWRWLPLVGLIQLFGLGTTVWGETVSQQALLEPAAFATLSSRMAGTIEAMHVREGGSFARGDLLVAFDCSMPKARLAKERADLQMAEKKQEVNRRMKELDSVSQMELALSEAMVQKARAEVGMAQVYVRYCEIHAPYDGRVSKRHVQPFDGVEVGSPLLDILANGPLRVSMYVPWSWSTWLTVKTPFAIWLQEGGPGYSARVTAIGARVDPASQTLGVWGEMNGPFPELLAGMSVTARLDPQAPLGEGSHAR